MRVSEICIGFHKIASGDLKQGWTGDVFRREATSISGLKKKREKIRKT